MRVNPSEPGKFSGVSHVRNSSDAARAGDVDSRFVESVNASSSIPCPFLSTSAAAFLWNGIELLKTTSVSTGFYWRAGKLNQRKLIFFTYDLGGVRGGPDQILMSQLYRLAMRNELEIHVVFSSGQNPSGPAVAIQPLGSSFIHYHVVPAATPETLSAEFRAINDRRPADLAILPPNSGDAAALAQFSKKLGVPCLYFAHGGEPLEQAELPDTPHTAYYHPYSDAFSQVLQNATIVAAVSQSALRGVTKVLRNSGSESAALTTVVAPLVESAIYDPKLVSPTSLQELRQRLGLQGKFVIFFPHNRYPLKGWQDALKMLKRVIDVTGNENIVLLGFRGSRSTLTPQGDDRYFSESDELIDQQGLRDNVVMLNSVRDPRDMRDLYALSNVVIAPTYFESMGLTILEATLMEKPVVAYRIGGTTEAKAEKVAAEFDSLLVDLGDIEGLATAIAQLHSEPELANRLSRRARNEVLAAHDPNQAITKQEELLADAISGIRWYQPSHPTALTLIDPHLSAVLERHAENADSPFPQETPARYMWMVVPAFFETNDDLGSSHRLLFEGKSVGFFYLHSQRTERLYERVNHETQHLAHEVARFLKAGFASAHVFVITDVQGANRQEEIQPLGNGYVHYHVIPGEVGYAYMEQNADKLRGAVPRDLVAASLHGHQANDLRWAIGEMGISPFEYQERIAPTFFGTYPTLTLGDNLEGIARHLEQKNQLGGQRSLSWS